MKLKTKLMMFTAVTALSASMAFAAINPETLAQSYRAEGYTYVEVTVGPTQTKLEAVKGDRKVEVIYSNATGDVIKSEFEDADDDYRGKTGVEIENSSDDFEDDDEADDEDDDNDDDEDDDSADDEDDSDDENDSDDEDDSDDESDSDDDSDNDSESDSGDDKDED